MTEYILKINGMHCSACEKNIAMTLEDIAGVHLKSISAKKGEAILDIDNDLALNNAKKAIESEGFKVL